MHDTTALVRPAANDYTPADNPRFVKLHRRFPTVAYLRRYARRHVPSFAFEYMDGGAGADGGIARNWSALDAVELVPRYGVTTALPPVDIELFGRRYSAPIGVAPMGGPSIVWPGADQYLATAAQRARVPYTLGLVGGMTVERAAEIAPDVLWSSSIAASATSTPSASILSAAPKRWECMSWFLPPTCRCAPRARARSRLALPRRFGRICAWSPAFSPRPATSDRCGNTGSRASAISSPTPPTPRTWTRLQPSCGARWAAPSLGTRSPAIASAGSVRW